MEYVRVPKSDWISILDTTREKSGYADAMVSGEVAAKIADIEGAGVELPELTNQAHESDLASGKELIGPNGEIVTGTLYEVKEDGSSFPLDANARLIDNSYGYIITRGAFNDQRAPEGVIVRPGGELWIQMPYTEYGNATADQVAKGATFTSAAGLLITGTAIVGTGDNIPDGTNVTFGNMDGTPVEREAVYAISSEDLNALGAIGQRASGSNDLLTISDVIYWLNRAQFTYKGVAESSFSVDFESSAVSTLQEE